MSVETRKTCCRFYLGDCAMDAMSERSELHLLDPGFGARCEAVRLNSFEALWALSGEAVEAPNRRRGGYSEVVLVNGTAADAALRFFLKRQRNQQRRSIGTRGRAHPTYWFEWQSIAQLQRHGDFAPPVLCYGEQRTGRESRALLAIAPLDGYVSLERFLQQDPPRGEREACLGRVGALLRRVHATGCEHGALYLKHIFVRGGEHPQVRLIDFERSRLRTSQRAAARRDIARLLRRATALEAADRAALLRAYHD